MLHVKSTLPELRAASLVATELPANVESGFEQLALSFAAKIINQCPRLLMIVQPSLRRRSNRSTWVSRWNQYSGQKPFDFVQTCSCRVGDGAPGCHVTTFVGTSEDLQWNLCNAVPSTDITVRSANACLEGLLRVFWDRIALLRPPLTSRAASRLIGQVETQSPSASPEVLQQTADSHCGPLCPHTARTDSAKNNSLSARSFPTDAKEREKIQRKLDKEKGIERQVRKKPKVCENHYDDCGDDLSSLDEHRTALAVFPSEYDTDEELYYRDVNQLYLPTKRSELPTTIDPASVRHPERICRDLPPDRTYPGRTHTHTLRGMPILPSQIRLDPQQGSGPVQISL